MDWPLEVLHTCWWWVLRPGANFFSLTFTRPSAPSARSPPPPQIPSDTVPFNQAPAMKAREICEAGKEALRSGKFDQVRGGGAPLP